MPSIVQLSLFGDKRCPQCRQVKPLDAFSLSQSRRDGRTSYCKECHKVYAAAHYRANKKKMNAQSREAYHRDIERNRAYHREHYYQNREKYLDKFREYRQRNPEYNRVYGRQYYEQNKEHLRIRNRHWSKTHRDEARALWHAYRARKRNAVGRHTAKEWRALRDWFGGYCLRCGAHTNLSADHVVPLIKGGANHIGNIQPLCKLCNSIKREQTIDYRDPFQLAAFLCSLPG